MNDWSHSTIYNLAKELAARPYDIIITPDEFTDGQRMWIAKSPEISSAIGQGLTASQAVKDLILARTDLFFFMLLDGQKIPATNHSKVEVYDVVHIFREAVYIDA